MRDNAQQNAFAKALETLGVDWGKTFPVPNYDINKYPECRKFPAFPDVLELETLAGVE
ncbi:hypothetical protein PCURB6_44370 [Paenibacillus curdlanolyticus]|nr:hypothetical protein PCURB6_44370 [Paenibacillus curdlanolyticus]